jgi:hypothetical protein
MAPTSLCETSRSSSGCSTVVSRHDAAATAEATRRDAPAVTVAAIARSAASIPVHAWCLNSASSSSSWRCDAPTSSPASPTVATMREQQPRRRTMTEDGAGGLRTPRLEPKWLRSHGSERVRRRENDINRKGNVKSRRGDTSKRPIGENGGFVDYRKSVPQR